MREKLFRYRPYNQNNIKAFSQDRLYYSTPENFNDPYDSLFFVDKERLKNSVKYTLQTEMEGFVKNVMCPGMAEDIQNNCLNFINDFVNNDNCYDIFWDDVAEKIKVLKKSMRKNAKIICFSEQNNSPLMWSHYADSHNGFLLEYDKKELENSIIMYDNDLQTVDNRNRLVQVEYSDERPDFGEYLYQFIPKYCMEQRIIDSNDMLEPEEQLLLNALRVKSTDWQYEKEWRLIPQNINISKDNNIKYIQIKPKAVYLGIGLDVERRKEIAGIAKEKEIAVYNVFMDDYSEKFAFEYKQE